MVYFTLFFIELLLLFFLSRNLTRTLSQFFFTISKSKQFSISALAFLFFPGTLIHELSHALSAGLLGVHVGKIEFVPHIEGEKVKLGSVQIAQTDPIRRFLIGAAPFFSGTVILLGILFYMTAHHFFNNNFVAITIGYVVFEIGNTMFSSEKDMEGALELFATIIIIIIVLYLMGLRLPSFNPNTLFLQPLVQEVFQRGSFFLLFPLAIDTLIIFLLKPKQ